MAFRAEATDYAGLHAACRARAEQLQASRLALDEIAGTSSGWFGKFLGPRQIRRLSMISLGPALAALGLKIVLIEDEEATKKIRSRLQPRTEYNVRHRERHDASAA